MTEAKQNTDREIYSRIQGDYYSPKIYVTEQDLISIDVGGHVISMKIEEWHKLARNIDRTVPMSTDEGEIRSFLIKRILNR